MEKNELKSKIVFRTDLVTEEKFRLLWSYLADFPVEMQKYDFSEPIKKTYLPDHKQADENYIKFLGTIFFRGKSKNNWIKLGHMIDGFSIISIYTVELKASKSIIEWIRNLLTIIPLEYVNITDSLEYDFKHKEVSQNSYGWQGGSSVEFLNHMPGIYWFNAFGGNYMNAVGKDNFKDLPNCEYVNFGNKMIAFHFKDSVIAENYEERIKNEQDVADKIGNSLFYDKYRKIDYSHPQKFIEYISEVEEERKKMSARIRQKYS
jgi:hypothetical protein